VIKRTFDCVAAALGLIVLSPLWLIVAVVIKLESKGPVFFRQQRIGQGFRPFTIYKFRTMAIDASQRGGAITCGEDPRVTRLGRLLRHAKIDELPQLINVLKGEMSLVGPRPEVATYVQMYRAEYGEILQVRPGITDLASIEFRDEQAILGRASNPEEEYVRRILPEKLRLSTQYVRHSSFVFDLRLIFRTLGRILWTS
jgi:lipopolysaccharide/colanic/teichoic acid biosynthesis glycosyltransferase